MKKLFISQPMKNKTEEEILKEREEIISKVKQEFNDEIYVLDSFFQPYELKYDNLGNITGMDIPSYNIIRKDDSVEVARAKQIAQFNQYSEYNDMLANAKPLWYLAKSIEMLSKADVAAFAKNWNKYRGCKIEHLCATEYEIPIIHCY